MKNFTKKLTSFLIKYRLVITAIVPLFFLFSVLLFVLLPTENQQLNPFLSIPTKTPTDTPGNQSPTSINIPDSHLEPVDPSRLKGLQKTELLPDKTTMYTVTSTNPLRPDLIHANNNGYPIFKRLVTPPSFPLSLKSFVDLYKPPKWIFKGSVFYGVGVNSYIYPELGIALVANPQTDQVFEQHIFQKTKVEDYVSKYGDDIPAQP